MFSGFEYNTHSLQRSVYSISPFDVYNDFSRTHTHSQFMPYLGKYLVMEKY